MTLHLIKLCVGVTTVEELAEWIAEETALARGTGRDYQQIHTTRQTPKRADDLLDGGSLYWVIKGYVQVRQPIIDLKTVRHEDGIDYCQIHLGDQLIRTQMQPRRAFQGWRYLEAKDAPVDLSGQSGDISGMPPEMRRELASLGLL